MTVTEHQLLITPTTGIYGTYKRISYKAWTAIAEFIDNSTQSYFNHKKELEAREEFRQLQIQITYSSLKDGDCLSIVDNAHGMEKEDFERSILLNQPPKDTSGRCEYGMGLKTAACWFGNIWKIETTQLGSNKLYKADISVPTLVKDEPDSIIYTEEEADPDEHYTIITLEQLDKKLTDEKTIDKTKKYLSSIYREDIRNDNIQITYNGQVLTFEEPEIFEEQLEDGSIKVWKEDVEFTISHENKMLPVKGFVAIRKRGSTKDAGFALIRRGRVITNDTDATYRPAEVVGNSNSFGYQRLFGELHMDSWPVSQAKDSFDWQNSGLEKAFTDALKNAVKSYRDKAENLRTRSSNTTETPYKNPIPFPIINPNQPKEPIPAAKAETIQPKVYPTPSLSNNQIIPRENINSNPHSLSLVITHKNIDHQFRINYVSSGRQSWLILKTNDNINFELTLNLDHSFFKPLVSNKDILCQFAQFIASMILAEYLETEGMNIKIDPGIIRMSMGTLLGEIQIGEK